MASRSLEEWQSSASTAFDEIESAHRAVGGTKPGRRFVPQQVNHAYVTLLAARFQGSPPRGLPTVRGGRLGVNKSAQRCCLRLEARLSLVEALEPVLGNRLPASRIGDEGSPARTHAWIAVESPHAHAHLRQIIGVATEQVRPALAAKALLEPAVWMTPRLHEVLSLKQPERGAVDPRLCRRGCARAPLAASAVAVPSGPRRLGQLEAHTAAQAAPCECLSCHSRQVCHFKRRRARNPQLRWRLRWRYRRWLRRLADCRSRDRSLAGVGESRSASRRTAAKCCSSSKGIVST
jgi:hypothetical protein